MINAIVLIDEGYQVEMVSRDLEAQAELAILVPADHRKPEAVQGVEQATLGDLDSLPAGEVSRNPEIGNEAVEAASATQIGVVGFGQHPIAYLGTDAGVAAPPVDLPVRRGVQRSPALFIDRLERAHHAEVR